MSDPISGTGLAGGVLTGVSIYGLFTGTDYGVVFGAFAGAVFYIATTADLTATRRLAYFIVSYIAGVLCSGLVGSKLANLTGYSDKPLDAIGGFAPIFPDTCYHLTHYWPAAADIPVASDNPVHYADAIRYNARTPLQGSLLPLTRLV